MLIKWYDDFVTRNPWHRLRVATHLSYEVQIIESRNQGAMSCIVIPRFMVCHPYIHTMQCNYDTLKERGYITPSESADAIVPSS